MRRTGWSFLTMLVAIVIASNVIAQDRSQSETKKSEQANTEQVNWHAYTAVLKSRTEIFDIILATPIRVPVAMRREGDDRTDEPVAAEEQQFNFQTNLLRFFDRDEALRRVPDPYNIYFNRRLEYDVARATEVWLTLAKGAQWYIGSPLEKAQISLEAIGRYYRPEAKMPAEVLKYASWGRQLQRGEFLKAGGDMFLDRIFSRIEKNIDQMRNQSLVVHQSGTIYYGTSYSDTLTRTYMTTTGRVDYSVSFRSAKEPFWGPSGPFDGTTIKQTRITETTRIGTTGAGWPNSYGNHSGSMLNQSSLGWNRPGGLLPPLNQLPWWNRPGGSSSPGNRYGLPPRMPQCRYDYFLKRQVCY